MKDILNKNAIAFLSIALFLTSCYSSRTYQHQFNADNRAIVRHVLEYGQVDCANCTLTANCPKIVDTVVTNDEYSFTANCALYSYLVKMKSQDNGTSFKIEVKCKLIIGRNKTAENYYLEALSTALFNSNMDYIKEELKKSNEQNKKQ